VQKDGCNFQFESELLRGYAATTVFVSTVYNALSEFSLLISDVNKTCTLKTKTKAKAKTMKCGQPPI